MRVKAWVSVTSAVVFSLFSLGCCLNDYDTQSQFAGLQMTVLSFRPDVNVWRDEAQDGRSAAVRTALGEDPLLGRAFVRTPGFFGGSGQPSNVTLEFVLDSPARRTYVLSQYATLVVAVAAAYAAKLLTQLVLKGDDAVILSHLRFEAIMDSKSSKLWRWLGKPSLTVLFYFAAVMYTQSFQTKSSYFDPQTTIGHYNVFNTSYDEFERSINSPATAVSPGIAWAEPGFYEKQAFFDEPITARNITTVALMNESGIDTQTAVLFTTAIVVWCALISVASACTLRSIYKRSGSDFESRCLNALTCTSVFGAVSVSVTIVTLLVSVGHYPEVDIRYTYTLNIENIFSFGSFHMVDLAAISGTEIWLEGFFTAVLFLVGRCNCFLND